MSEMIFDLQRFKDISNKKSSTLISGTSGDDYIVNGEYNTKKALRLQSTRARAMIPLTTTARAFLSTRARAMTMFLITAPM